MNRRKCREFQRNSVLLNRFLAIDFTFVKTIIALDISFQSGKAYTTVILFSVADKTVTGVYAGIYDDSIPYVPTFLAFREIPQYLRLLKTITEKFDIILCDRYETLHPYSFGRAAHSEMLLNKPSTGVAKSALCGTFLLPVHEQYSLSPLIDNGELLGYAFTNREKTKPIFISPEHKISFEKSLELVTMVSGKFRVPSPLHSADRALKLLCKQGIV